MSCDLVWFIDTILCSIFSYSHLIIEFCWVVICVFSFMHFLINWDSPNVFFEQIWHNIIFYMHFFIVGTFKIISFFATENSPVYQTTLWESWVGWKELSQLIHLYVLLSWAIIYNSHWVSFICSLIHYTTTTGNINLCLVWFSGNIFIVWINVKQGVDLRPLGFFS